MTEEELDTVLQHPTKRPIAHGVCVIGHSGVGKTSLLAAAGTALIEANPDALVIMHFVGLNSESTDYRHVLWRIVNDLSELLSMSHWVDCQGKQLADNPEGLISQLPEFLASTVDAAQGQVNLLTGSLWLIGSL